MIGYEVIVIPQEREPDGLEVIKEVIRNHSAPSTRMWLPIGPSNRLQLDWPQKCCCCGTLNNLDSFSLSHAEKRYHGNTATSTSVRWVVPYCKDCLKHMQGYRYTAVSLIFGIFFSALALFISGLSASLLQKWLTIVLPIILAVSAMIILHYKHIIPYKNITCATNGPAIHYDGWNGEEHIFDFANQKYMREFVSTNHAKINREIEFYDSLIGKENLESG